MADRPPDHDPADSPDRYPGMPGWVKLLGLVLLLVLLLAAFIVATGLGGPHGPQRHGASAASASEVVGRAARR